jgi:hypothetical protein
LVKHSFFTDDLVRAGSFICIKSSENDCFNAVCFADCQNDVNPDDEFLLSISDESGTVKESKQSRLRVIGYMQQYFSGKLDWQDEIDWNE